MVNKLAQMTQLMALLQAEATSVGSLTPRVLMHEPELAPTVESAQAPPLVQELLDPTLPIEESTRAPSSEGAFPMPNMIHFSSHEEIL